jgi:hypothetical protein
MLNNGVLLCYHHIYITKSLFAETPFLNVKKNHETYLFAASATALTHLVWLRAGGDNIKHALKAQRKEGRSPG